MLKGLIVSEKLRENKSKKIPDFVILCATNKEILCYNLKKCEELNIPYAVYFPCTSYTKDALKATIEEINSILEPYKPFAIFSSFMGTAHRSMGAIALTHLVNYYIQNIKYPAGIFIDKYHITNCIIPERLDKNKCLIWGDIDIENCDIYQKDNDILEMSESILKL